VWLGIISAAPTVATAPASRHPNPFASLVILLVLTAPLAHQEKQPPDTGTIEGVVLDDQGKPLADAVVYGLPERDMRDQIHTTTDKNGRFTLHSVPAGGIYLSAFKESDWYPYNFFSFFLTPGQKTPNKVQVKGGQTTASAVIRMGERAARLNIKIEDERGAPLSSAAELVFTRPDMPGEYSRGVNSKISLLVPPVPFTLAVRAEGYEPWHYAATQDRLLRLRPRQTFDLTVTLKRIR